MDVLQAGKILILSDIHGNYTALESVLAGTAPEQFKGIILLGDLIDYGPNSNEVIQLLNNKLEQKKILVNIWGNHEKAVIRKAFSGFSSQRGVECARITSKNLNKESYNYINKMNPYGKQEFFLGKYRCLAVHGSLEDPFWKSIAPDNVNGDYREYDYIFSGHSHCPHMFAKFYSSNDDRYRNRKRTVFINPGSVGQPRNHNPRASYAVFDVESEAVELRNILYDVKREQKSFGTDIDDFYRMRLERGI